MEKRYQAETWNDALFAHPTALYRAIPFWSWNCKVTKALIDSQLAIVKQMGFGGVDIHPRTGLDTEYMSDTYLELVRYAAKKCEELGLICWLYDDDRFPSGCADGLVTRQHPEYRGRFLLLTVHRLKETDGFFASKEAFARAIASGEKPEGYFLTAYAIQLQDGCLQAYQRLKTEEEIQQALRQGKCIRYAYQKLMPEQAWFQGQAYVDTMNPAAIAEFLRVTHEAYYAKMGDDFGKVIPAIFTDEPRMGKHQQLAQASSDADVTIPYNEYFAETMREEKHIDPLDDLPLYVWNCADESHRAYRYHYRDMTAECFVRAFMDQIADWCKAHHIDFTGHVLSEESLTSQVFALGDCMRCYRKMDVPGVDILCDFREFSTVKQAVSVSRQMGRAGTMSELYGVTHWDCDFKTFKLQGDWQAALGITIRVPHLSHMSLQGEAKRDWPGSIFFQAPWYQQWPMLEDHFARLNTVLTSGKPCVSVGVIHPVESMWLDMGPDDQTLDGRREMDEDFQNLIRWLLLGTVDFDFLSESLLPQLCDECCVTPGVMRVGAQEYRTVIVPNMTTIRSTTLARLEAFQESGGQIIFLGCVPSLVDALPSTRAAVLAEKCLCIGKDRATLRKALAPVREVGIRTTSGQLSDNLVYQLRQDEGGKWLFVSHAYQRRQNTTQREDYVIRVKGHYLVTQYDTQTGRTAPALCYAENGDTCIPCGLYAQDSVLYRLEDGMPPEEKLPLPQKSYRTVYRWTPETRNIRRERSEPNVLLLDMASCRVDDGPVQPQMEILRQDNHIRHMLGFAPRNGSMMQPYCTQERETHRVTLIYHFDSLVALPVQLALEEPQVCRVWLNGIKADTTPVSYYVDPAISVIDMPKTCVGDNELVVEVQYNQKTNLEALYLLGAFGVRLAGDHPILEEEMQDARLGDITRQDLPFYTGNLSYQLDFEVAEEGGVYAVHVPHFVAPLLGIALDGVEMGTIAYAPHRLSLGKISKGQHTLTVRVYGNRYNAFGTLHLANPEFLWFGPDSYRTEGDDWTDGYRGKPVGILSTVEMQREE